MPTWLTCEPFVRSIRPTKLARVIRMGDGSGTPQECQYRSVIPRERRSSGARRCRFMEPRMGLLRIDTPCRFTLGWIEQWLEIRREAIRLELDSGMRKYRAFARFGRISPGWHRACLKGTATSAIVVDGPAREVLARWGRPWLPPQSRVIGRSAQSRSARSLTFLFIAPFAVGGPAFPVTYLRVDAYSHPTKRRTSQIRWESVRDQGERVIERSPGGMKRDQSRDKTGG